jgi:hypothetical protein
LLDYVDSLAAILPDSDANGGLDQRLYVQQDANYNVTSLIDNSTGLVVERYVYDPYGRRTVLDADWSVDADGQSDVGMVYGHQGGRYDDVTHLAHFRNRDLHVLLGRWNRQDPLGYVVSVRPNTPSRRCIDLSFCRA